MSDQVARLLALVPYLQSHPGAGVAHTAKAFGVTAAQLRKDLEILWMCGRPGLLPDDLIEIDMDAVADEGRIYLGNADDLARPLRLTADEALALTLALAAARDLADAETVVAIDSARAKVQAVVGEQPLDVVAAKLAGGDVDVRTVLTDAIAAHRRVRFDYDGLRRTSQPVVEPARLFVRDGIAYLQAWSLEAGDWRTFRLDRIAVAEPLAETFTPRKAPAVGDSWLDTLPFAAEVTLTLAPEAAWVAEYYPVREVNRDGENTTVRLGVVGWTWLTALLLRLGAGVLAVDPPEAAVSARASARAALARYGVESWA